MNTQLTIRERIRRHERDVVLLGHLFDGWRRASVARSTAVGSRLAAIDAQLARLERTVRMAADVRRPPEPFPDRPDNRRAAVPLAAQTP